VPVTSLNKSRGARPAPIVSAARAAKPSTPARSKAGTSVSAVSTRPSACVIVTAPAVSGDRSIAPSKRRRASAGKMTLRTAPGALRPHRHQQVGVLMQRKRSIVVLAGPSNVKLIRRRCRLWTNQAPRRQSRKPTSPLPACSPRRAPSSNSANVPFLPQGAVLCALKTRCS
jgi:hypothetical protein